MYGAHPSVSRSCGVGGRPGFLGASTTGTLPPGHHLIVGETLTSPNGQGRLTMQADGNLVLYGPNGALWNTGKNGGQKAEMQTDGNFVVYNHAGHAVFDTKTGGRPGSRLVFQDDGNLVVYERNTPYWNTRTGGWTPAKDGGGPMAAIEHAIESATQTVVRAATGNQNINITSIGKIPVVSDVANIVGEAAMAPLHLASAIASGQRLDHALVGALKEQLKIVKDVAPYAQTVVSMMPGIGSGVAAALGTGIALAEGQNITTALKSGVRSMIPGGPLAQAGFDAALKVASGENVGKAALEGVRSQLSPAAQKAFDVGLAVVTGEKIQTAIANGLASIAPAQLQQIVAVGQKALGGMPNVAEALKSVAPGAATQGFQLAAGLLSSAGINEKAIVAARNGLPPEVKQGFDLLLKSQEPHVAWLANVTGTPSGPAPQALEPPKRAPTTPAPQALEPPKRTATAPTQAAPQALEPPKKKTPTMYGPYPQGGALSAPPPHPQPHPHPMHGGGHGHPIARGGGHHGWGSGFPWLPVTATCRTWGDPVKMSVAMENAANSALDTSSGRPTAVRGPDDVLYLFSLENNVPTARPCVAVTGALGWCGVGEEAWGAAITNMPQHMEWAGRSAVHGSKGHPRKVQGPDGTTYLFAIENGTLTARPSIST